MKVIACRGEYEPASFVVRTDEPLTDVRLDVSPLHGPSAVLPAPTLTVEGVRLANAPGAASKDKVRVKSVDVRLQLLPLLRCRSI